MFPAERPSSSARAVVCSGSSSAFRICARFAPIRLASAASGSRKQANDPVEAGKIELTAPLGKYLRDYPNQDVATKVTIHHLLTHTGGTGDIFGPDFEAHRMELRTLADYVELYGKRGLEFEPGSRWAYSNYGMVLLGVVIEKVTGQSYYDYVQAHVYEPAGMTASGSLPEDQAVPDRSIGYTKLLGRPPGTTAWVPNTDTLPYRGTSAGGGYSTVGDLARFAHALSSHELLRPDSTELLITGKVESGPGAKYACGFEDGRDAVGKARWATEAVHPA